MFDSMPDRLVIINWLETECMIYSFIKLTDWLTKELLIIHSYLEKDCWKKGVRQSWKVIIKSYDQYTFPDTVAVEPFTFVTFI